MKITEDVRKYAAEQGIAGEEVLKKGMEENPASSRRREASFTRKREADILAALKERRV